MTPLSNLLNTPDLTTGHPTRLRTTAWRSLRGRRGLYTLAVVLAVAGLALGGARWGIAAILPLLYTLPCAAMMAMCMRGYGGSGQSSGAAPTPTANLLGGSASEQAGPR